MIIKRGKLINRLLLITLLFLFIYKLSKCGLMSRLIITMGFYSLLWIAPIFIIILTEKLHLYDEKKKEDSKIIEIKQSAFVSSSLRSIRLPSRLQRIDNEAFSLCRRLTQIIIPKNVEYMGNMVFSHCDEIKIYCEVESKPEQWHDKWNMSGGFNNKIYDTSWDYKVE